MDVIIIDLDQSSVKDPCCFQKVTIRNTRILGKVTLVLNAADTLRLSGHVRSFPGTCRFPNHLATRADPGVILLIVLISQLPFTAAFVLDS